MALSTEQQARLREAKLQSIVTTRWGPGDRTGGSFPSGATVDDGTTGWVLSESGDVRILGGALAWAARADLARLWLVVEDAADAVLGDLARMASRLVRPVAVMGLDGTDPIEIGQAPMPVELGVPAGLETLIATIEVAGCDVVVEQGIVRGDWLGLEVCRVEVDAGGPRLAVGVGRFDREITQLTYAALSAPAALARVVELISEHRRPGAPTHPMRDLCRERWLRCALVAAPSLVGATTLSPVEATVPRDNLRDPNAAMAAGLDVDGRLVVVAATVGADLGALLVADDTRARIDAGASLVVAHPAETPLPPGLLGGGGWLSAPPRVVGVASPWHA